MNSKENILNKIQKALQKPTPKPFDVDVEVNVFNKPSQELEIEFAQKFSVLQGKFSYCVNMQDLVEQLNQLITQQNWIKVVCNEKELHQKLTTYNFTSIDTKTALANCDVAITSCENLIARTGSILLSTASESGRTYSVYAPIHICIAFSNQLVYDIGDGLNFLQKKYKNNLPSVISLATGPSRTADIEKTLVVGVHGPKEVYCFLVDE